jgi:hypothetical protein
MHVVPLALLAATGSSTVFLLVIAAVVGVFAGHSLRTWRNRRK